MESKAGEVNLLAADGKTRIISTAREAAARIGQQWYMPHKPCEKCEAHVARTVSDNRCRNCGDKLPTKNVPPTGEVISATNAIAKGFEFYFTGKPCPQGHVTFRYTSNRRCALCR